MDARGIEAVGGLVEDQRVRVPQQRAGQREALAHPERVGAHRPAGRRGELDELHKLVHPAEIDPCGQRQHAQMVAPRAAESKSPDSSTAPTRRTGVSSSA